MSPDSFRLMAVAGSSLLAGAVLGSYATSTVLDGPAKAVNPRASLQKAEKCECNCEEKADGPQVVPANPEGTPQVADAPLPGLPPSALIQARQAVQSSLRPCMSSTIAEGQGALVLAMTVTATGGQGFISAAAVEQPRGDTEWAYDCLLRRARATRFSWAGGDGEQTLKMPLRVGY